MIINTFTALTTLVLLLICFVFYFVFIKPWRSIQFYRKQGCQMKYFPIIGTHKSCLDAITSFGDFYGHIKNEVKINPSLKAIGGNLLDRPHLYLTNPEVIRDFYQKHEYYKKAPLFTELLRIIIGDGLVTAQDDMWKKHRKILSSAFHYDLQREMVPDIVCIADQFLENLKQGNLNEVNAINAFESITGEVVGRLFFGSKFSDYRIQGMPVATFLGILDSQIGIQLPTMTYILFGAQGIRSKILPSHRKIMNDIEDLTNFAKEIIEKKKEEIKARTNSINPKSSNHARSMIDVLLNSDDKLLQDTFTSQEIIDEFLTFFVAGMDTTGHLVAMAVYQLHQNPHFKSNLMAEVDKYFQDPSKVTLDTLHQMEFMTAFIKETLRMTPPTGILMDRVALKDHHLGDLQIKKGTVVNISLLASNFNPAYHEDENVFNPERWLQNDSKTKQTTSKNSFIFIPFSAGQHNCIGQHLAMNEAKVILSLFLKKYDFILSPSYHHKMMMRMLYEPVDKLNFKLVPKF